MGCRPARATRRVTWLPNDHGDAVVCAFIERWCFGILSLYSMTCASVRALGVAKLPELRRAGLEV